ALVRGGDGNFYGTTTQGGILDRGTVFKVTPDGRLTTLVHFNNNNGAFPAAGLTLGRDGNLYGTTTGGANDSRGSVFRVTLNGALTTLARFPSDYGSVPGGLTLGRDGNFYGTTFNGLAGNYGSAYHETVFKVTTNGRLITLARLSGSRWPCPANGLALGNDGSLYGTTFEGGVINCGTVFKVTTDGTLSTLANFTLENGFNPAAGLTLGDDGNFYGTALHGGRGGHGSVFEVTPDGTLTTLFHFIRASGGYSYAPLTLGSNGSLYGTTYSGGSNDTGVIFRLDLPPAITSQPASRTNVLDTTATFTVTAAGTRPFGYQWLKNGTNIVDGGNASGARTGMLTLSHVQLDDAGNFAVIVTNNSGGVTGSVAALTVRVSTGGPKTLTFDDLLPGSIPNGYGGLQWNSWGVLDGSVLPVTSGFRTGLVSPDNVAFCGYPASISSATPFTLKSAYLTMALDSKAGPTEMHVRVQGSVGTTVTYDHTYTVSNAAPAFINFDYLGVDRVVFVGSPDYGVVMDNLTVTVPPAGAGCTFAISPRSRVHGFGSETGVVSVTTQAGCAWSVSNTNSWVTILSGLNNSSSGTVTYLVAADPTAVARSGFINIAGQNFAVTQSARPTVDPALLTFDDLLPGLVQNGYGRLRWNNWGVLDGSVLPVTSGFRAGVVSPDNVAFNRYGDPASISSDTPFTLKSAYLTMALDSQAGPTEMHVRVQGSVGTAVTYDHTYTVINAAPTFINFDYLGVDRVVFVGSPDYIFAVDDLTVTVPARAPVDAGRVQTVVHLSLQSNGDMTVTFAGTLQSASDIDGPFEDVPGNPQGTYTIPKANLTTHRYFRAKGD
ncbi:MAG: hypothetical protein DME18_11205, partial [Verrucomicrobia bacterium]